MARATTVWRSFGDRFPWLLANVAGGLACAALAGVYEPLLEAAVVLALFIPVVLALTESVSIQSVTLTLQALHRSGLDWRFFRTAISRELVVAALLGAGCGTLVGVAAGLWKTDLTVAVAVGFSMTLAMITASLMGVVLPSLLKTFRHDPRVAAGPIVLALADVATLLFYFNISGIVLA